MYVLFAIKMLCIQTYFVHINFDSGRTDILKCWMCMDESFYQNIKSDLDYLLLFENRNSQFTWYRKCCVICTKEYNYVYKQKQKQKEFVSRVSELRRVYIFIYVCIYLLLHGRYNVWIYFIFQRYECKAFEEWIASLRIK